MIPNRSGTGGVSEPARADTEGKGEETIMKKTGSRMWLTPILLALPTAAGLAYAAIRFGGRIQNLIQVAIKLAVTK